MRGEEIVSAREVQDDGTELNVPREAHGTHNHIWRSFLQKLVAKIFLIMGCLVANLGSGCL